MNDHGQHERSGPLAAEICVKRAPCAKGSARKRRQRASARLRLRRRRPRHRAGPARRGGASGDCGGSGGGTVAAEAAVERAHSVRAGQSRAMFRHTHGEYSPSSVAVVAFASSLRVWRRCASVAAGAKAAWERSRRGVRVRASQEEAPLGLVWKTQVTSAGERRRRRSPRAGAIGGGDADNRHATSRACSRELFAFAASSSALSALACRRVLFVTLPQRQQRRVARAGLQTPPHPSPEQRRCS